eukprot:403346565
MATTTQEIAENVFLIIKKMDTQATDNAHTVYIYSVEVKEVSIVDVTLDFSEGFHIQVENSNDLKASATIKPMTQETVAVVRAYEDNWGNSCKVLLQKRSPSIADQKNLIKLSVVHLEREILKSELYWKDFPIANATLVQIREKLSEQGPNANFIDVNFPPTDQSIQEQLQIQKSLNHFSISKGLAYDRVIHWRRPKEFMTVDASKGLLEPQVYSSLSPSDIKSGQLNNQWLLNAFGILAERPALLERIFVTKHINDMGIYEMKLCINGEWQSVIVDDYIPCYPNGGPIFSSCHQNELWVSLLEKAFAKVRGGYQNLTKSLSYQALQDLTGFPTLPMSFNEQKVKELYVTGKLWSLVQYYNDEGYILSGRSNPAEFSSNTYSSKLIPAGISLAIIQVKELEGHKLLQIRNPWSSFEWRGDWGNYSQLWTKDMKDQLKPDFSQNTGSFWMSFKDFVEQFDNIDVCKTRNWNEVRTRGRMMRVPDHENITSEQVQSKWIYALEVPTKSHIIISLNQEDENISGVLPKRPYIDLGLQVMQINKEEGSTLLTSTDYLIQRTNECELILEEGQYVVVPRTTGCLLRRPDGAEVESIKLVDNQGNFNPLFTSTLKDLFTKLDLLGKNTVPFREFNGILETIGKAALKDEIAYKSEILTKYNSYEDGLTLRGFFDWWKAQIVNEGEAAIWVWIDRLGYDRDLYSLRSRIFNIQIHSRPLEGEETINVIIKDSMGTDMDSKVTEMNLAQYGIEEASSDQYQVISLFSPGSNSYTFGIRNIKDFSIEVMLDLSFSENMTFSSKGPIVKKVVKPGQIQFMMHAQAGYGNYSKVVKHSSKEIVIQQTKK